MSSCGYRAGRGGRPRLRLPERLPSDLNHAIVAGTLAEDPRPGRSPVGAPIILLRIEFPVADPERPHVLWTWASCEVEVPSALAEQRGVGEMRAGFPVFVAGQLSERWTIQGGRTGKQGAIVAALIHRDMPLADEGPLVPGAPGSAGTATG